MYYVGGRDQMSELKIVKYSIFLFSFLFPFYTLVLLHGLVGAGSSSKVEGVKPRVSSIHKLHSFPAYIMLGI